MIRLGIMLLAVLSAYVAWRLLKHWLSGRPLAQSLRQLRSILLTLAVAAIVVLIVTGRLPLLIAFVATLLAFASRLLPGLLRLGPALYDLWLRYRPTGASGAGESTVRARFVRMRLMHSSGELDGEILEGVYAGKHLRDLDLTVLARLYTDWRDLDPESAMLLEAYLDRIHGPTWRAPRTDPPPPSGQMTRHEALEILGLEASATRADILAAHRRLIQKVHPDRGGSDYLAAQINRAKDVLLDAD